MAVDKQKKAVLVIGSGAREHAIAHQLSISDHIGEIFVAPGNRPDDVE